MKNLLCLLSLIGSLYANDNGGKIIVKEIMNDSQYELTIFKDLDTEIMMPHTIRYFDISLSEFAILDQNRFLPKSLVDLKVYNGTQIMDNNKFKIICNLINNDNFIIGVRMTNDPYSYPVARVSIVEPKYCIYNNE